MELAGVTQAVIGCAIEVHRCLGPVFLESAYAQCPAHEMAGAGIAFERKKAVGIRYKDLMIDCGFRIDMLVEKRVVVELKAVDRLQPLHRARLLTYLKISGASVGLLINFNSKILKDGLFRLVL